MPTPLDQAQGAANASKTGGVRSSPRFDLAPPYRPGVFLFNYKARAFVLSPQQPASQEHAEPRPNIPVATHQMIIGVVGTIAEKWEKPAAWLLTGFAAVVALIISNYDKAAGLLGARAVHAVVLLFFLTAVAHAVQQIFSTLLQAGVAGGKVGRELKLENVNEEELRQLMDGLVEAYPWPMKRFLRSKYDQLLEHGFAPFSKSMARMAATLVWSAVAQMLFGLVAVGIITWSLMRITWVAPTPATSAPPATSEPLRQFAPPAVSK
ncbi:hypothetical protein ACSFA2_00675 [Variovorax sp. LT2P21]|uniref:hypothetical protein n=1 Tax=Variovorax sp. LT2P21 TaxID=3443731 RepID=UPI003F456D01